VPVFCASVAWLIFPVADVVVSIDFSRSCLFRRSDIGQAKAKAAAEAVQKRCKGVTVKASRSSAWLLFTQFCLVGQWYHKKLQDFRPLWYSQFHFVMAGLRDGKARSWLNQASPQQPACRLIAEALLSAVQTLVDLARFDADGDVDWSTVVFFVDGSCERFSGQVRTRCSFTF
jgi:molybdopterin/thiamine biosynthesis adenylyltransferase